jgi:hypothetical protein
MGMCVCKGTLCHMAQDKGSCGLRNWLPTSIKMREIHRVAKQLLAFKEELNTMTSFSCDLFYRRFRQLRIYTIVIR